MVRGATRAMVSAVLGWVLMLGGWLLAVSLGPVAVDPQHVPPAAVLVKGAAATLGMLLGYLTVILAIIWGRGALKRMYNEPGAWRGAARARMAIIVGAVGAAAPWVLIGARIAWRVLHARQTGG